ncbi:uncharacterized protein LOC119513085 isoform X2 [Choloepus didactylus]|uniref:uncharacterized protein LOC119513085 isoform X2 n=1 Tax=Choloepus didactylus TaxID=27675 RepID=UPI00189F21BE|nr:uncharacterized protein LOC119513085 isoform X2 [Choloepus didactylus]
MQRKEPLGAAGGLKGESPEGATREVPGEIRRAEAGAGLPPGTVLFHGSGPSQYSGRLGTRSTALSRPSGGFAVLGSGPSQPPGGVSGHGLGSGTYPAIINTPCPGTSLSGASNPGSGGSEASTSRVYIEGCSPHTGSICSHSHSTHEDRPRSILKNNNSCILMQKRSNVEKSDSTSNPLHCPYRAWNYKGVQRKFFERGKTLRRGSLERFLPAPRKKAQRWDEMNIMATYHPAGKDYGLMKVDEPSTPYHRLQDCDDDMHAGSSHTVTPQALADRLATMDNFHPKVLQNSDTRFSESLDIFSKTYSSDFEQHRRTHYDEGKFLRTPKTLPLDDEGHCYGGSAGVSSGGQGVMLDPESRPVERGSKRGSARGVKDETGLVTRSHVPEAKAAHANGNHPPAPTPTKLEKEFDRQRKEYHSMGRYLRSCSYPETEEDTDNEQQESFSTSLPLVVENPMRTEVRLLDHTGSPFLEHKAESSLTLTATPSQPGTPLPGSLQVMSGWCQWLVTKRPGCQNPAGSERESVNNQSPSRQSERRREPQQGQGCLHWPGR